MARPIDTASDRFAGGQRQAGARDWIGLTVTLLATFMGTLDTFVVNVAIPSIRADFRTGLPEAQFVVAGYALAYAVALTTGGRLGDAAGHRRVFRAGVGCFIAASLACSAAPTIEALIAFRAAQGLAAALMLPQALSIIRTVFPEAQRSLAVSMYGGTLGVATVSGQIVGGALVGANLAGAGWRTIFLANLPVGLLVLLAARRALPETRAEEASRLDVGGALLLAAALGAVLVPLGLGPEQGWGAPYLVSLVGGLLLAVVFFGYERLLAARGGDPLLRPRLLRSSGFRAGVVALLVYFSGSAGLNLLLAYYLQAGLGQSPLTSGLEFAPLGVGFAAGSLAARRWVRSHGAAVLVAGALSMALTRIAMVPLLGLPGLARQLPLEVVIGASGFTQGLVAAPAIDIILARVPRRDAGVAAGALLTAVSSAMSLGVAVFGGLYARFLAQATGAEWQRHARAFTLCLCLMAALALATAFFVARLSRQSAAVEA